MRWKYFAVAVVGMSLAAVKMAVADVVDDFTLVGGGNTIEFSLPGTALIMDHPHGVYLSDSIDATVNGVAGYTGTFQDLVTGGLNLPNLILELPPFTSGALFGDLTLSGPFTTTYVVVPISNPTPFYPDNLDVTFVAGNYNFYPGYTLTITPEATSATPEPGTLVLAGSGLAGIAGVLRRRILGRVSLRAESRVA